MKRQLLFLFISLLSLTAFAQDNADSLFTKASKFRQEKNFSAAIIAYQKIALKHSPDYNRSIFYLACTYTESGHTEKAKSLFEQIRASAIQDSVSYDNFRGLDFFYYNFKYLSTLNIAQIEFEKRNYKTALAYYRECNDKYTFYSSCGTDSIHKREELKKHISDCIAAIGDKK